LFNWQNLKDYKHTISILYYYSWAYEVRQKKSQTCCVKRDCVTILVLTRQVNMLELPLSQCLVVFPWVVTRGPRSHGVFHILTSLMPVTHQFTALSCSHHIVRSVCIYSLSVSMFVKESLFIVTPLPRSVFLVSSLVWVLVFGLFIWIFTPAWKTTSLIILLKTETEGLRHQLFPTVCFAISLPQPPSGREESF